MCHHERSDVSDWEALLEHEEEELPEDLEAPDEEDPVPADD